VESVFRAIGATFRYRKGVWISFSFVLICGFGLGSACTTPPQSGGPGSTSVAATVAFELKGPDNEAAEVIRVLRSGGLRIGSAHTDLIRDRQNPRIVGTIAGASAGTVIDGVAFLLIIWVFEDDEGARNFATSDGHPPDLPIVFCGPIVVEVVELAPKDSDPAALAAAREHASVLISEALANGGWECSSVELAGAFKEPM